MDFSITSRSTAGASVYIEEISCVNRKWEILRYAYGDSEARSHAVEIIWVFTHDDNFWNDGIARPPNSKDFG